MTVHSIYKHIVIAFILFTACSILMTYPLVNGLYETSYGGEALALTYAFSWGAHALTTDPLHLFNANRNFPVSHSFALTENSIGSQLLYLPIYYLSDDPLLATNVMIILTFILNGLAMFFLCWHYTKNPYASILSGFIFSFFPGRLQFYHIQLCQVFWAPLGILFCERWLRTFKLREGLAMAFCFAMQMLVSINVGLMTAIAILLLVGIHWRHGTGIQFRQMIKASLLPGLLVLLLVAPILYPYYMVNKSFGFSRKLGEVVQYSADGIESLFRARPGSLLYGQLQLIDTPEITRIENWFFHHILSLAGNKITTISGADKLPGQSPEEKLSLEKFADLWSSGRGEACYWLGFLTWFLLLLSIRHMRFNTHNSPGKLIKRYSTLLIILYLFALGPVLVLWGHLTYIPMPYLILYLLPGFQSIRVASRFIILMMVAVSLLAGIGYAGFLENITRNKLRKRGIQILLTGLFLTGLAAEFFLVNKTYIPDNGKDNVPAVYSWIKENPSSSVIAILPQQQGNLTKYDAVYGAKRVEYKLREFRYMYYSIFAGFPQMVNGAGGFTPPVYFELRDAINDLSNTGNREQLQELGITTIVIHYDLFEPEDWERWNSDNLRDAGLQEVIRFGNDAVYTWN